MHLIKVFDFQIEDIENGRTYTLNESIPDYESNTASTTVYVRAWFSDNPQKTVDLAHELDAIKLWEHLTSLCKLNTVDPPKAQDAPIERTFKALDTVSVDGVIGYVQYVKTSGRVGVCFEEDYCEYDPEKVQLAHLDEIPDWFPES